MEILKDKRLWLVALLAAVVLVLLTYQSPAKAEGWTGCYGGVAVGYGSSNTEADLNVGGIVGVNIDGLGAQGVTVTPSAGCDYQANKIVVGLFGDYTWHDDSTFDSSVSFPGGSIGIASFSIDNEWSIGGRAGYLLTDDALAYGLIAYSKMEMSDLDLLSGTPAALSVDLADHDGWSFGGGMEVRIAPSVYLRGEYRYTDYDSESVEIVPGLDLDLDPDVQTARLGVVYKLGMPGMAPAPLK